jgi:hypothetical protein
MPSVSQMVKNAARNKGVRQEIAEKDYALSFDGFRIPNVEECVSGLGGMP